jgi:hypothetical protein
MSLGSGDGDATKYLSIRPLGCGTHSIGPGLTSGEVISHEIGGAPSELTSIVEDQGSGL